MSADSALGSAAPLRTVELRFPRPRETNAGLVLRVTHSSLQALSPRALPQPLLLESPLVKLRPMSQ